MLNQRMYDFLKSHETEWDAIRFARYIRRQIWRSAKFNLEPVHHWLMSISGEFRNAVCNAYESIGGCLNDIGIAKEDLTNGNR